MHTIWSQFVCFFQLLFGLWHINCLTDTNNTRSFSSPPKSWQVAKKVGFMSSCSSFPIPMCSKVRLQPWIAEPSLPHHHQPTGLWSWNYTMDHHLHGQCFTFCKRQENSQETNQTSLRTNAQKWPLPETDEMLFLQRKDQIPLNDHWRRKNLYGPFEVQRDLRLASPDHG